MEPSFASPKAPLTLPPAHLEQALIRQLHAERIVDLVRRRTELARQVRYHVVVGRLVAEAVVLVVSGGRYRFSSSSWSSMRL